MKKIVCLFFFSLFLISTGYCQEMRDDARNIAIGVCTPTSLNDIPANCMYLLSNRLKQVVALNGIGSTSSRFVIVPTVSILSTEAAAGVPVQYVSKVEVTIALLDLVEKTIMNQCSVSLSGVDDTPDKSINQAFVGMNVRNAELKKFIVQGKDKIVHYFQDNCDKILDKAEVLYKCKNYESALLLTTNIPDFCKDCTAKAKDLTLLIFQKYEDNNCQQLLQRAKTEYAQQNFQNALACLSLISQSSSCFDEASRLVNEIGKSHKELTDKIYDRQKEDRDKQLEIIKAYVNKNDSDHVNYNWYLNK